MFDVGDRIWWEAVNGTVSGIIEEILPDDNFRVRLDNGKYVIVHELSIQQWEK